jgi:hypothetical protein
MSLRQDLADPWVRSGLALLAALSVLTVLLYRNAPATVEEARATLWASARPDAVGPQLASAREGLERARRAADAGRDSLALLAYDEAARRAAAAWELASDDSEAAPAVALWAEAALGSAEVLLRAGTGRGLRPDDEDPLRAALERARQVIAAPVDSITRARAADLGRRIERQLRPGPLEWLPPWRS